MTEQFKLDIPVHYFGSDDEREYGRTHPWLRFKLSLTQAPPRLWFLLGEAQSKCESLGRIPLPPKISQWLHLVYMAKGIHGTTAIEGNTLTEEQVKEIVEKDAEFPPSMDYLKREVINVRRACEMIAERALTGQDARVSPELICEFNGMVLENLELEESVIPGKIRQHDVGVMRYRAPNWQDCPHLLARLSRFLNYWEDEGGRDTDILRAIVAHVYLAWIHPFGDGNGRTARLLEFHIMVNSGIPTPAAHLLSNHYNQTRSRYLQELDRTSKSGGDLVPFLIYALEGLVDHLGQQVKLVQAQQITLSWRDYVYEHFRGRESPVMHRRRDLLLELSWKEKPVKKRGIRTLSPEIEEAYRDKTDKTITRDLNWLIREDLVRRQRGGYTANNEIILGFLPQRRLDRMKEFEELEQEAPVLETVDRPGLQPGGRPGRPGSIPGGGT